MEVIQKKNGSVFIFRYIALMSGLNLGKREDAGNSMLGPLELAVSWLTGQGGDMPTQEQMSKVDRVILAGNCLAPETRDNDDNTAKYLTKNKDATSIGNSCQFNWRIWHNSPIYDECRIQSAWVLALP